jgi:hypothetical protein
VTAACAGMTPGMDVTAAYAGMTPGVDVTAARTGMTPEDGRDGGVCRDDGGGVSRDVFPR